MNITPISAIATLPNGTKLEAIAGRIVSIKDHRAGVGGSGPWTMQDVEINDGTGKIKVVLKDQPDLPKSWTGHTVIFKAAADGRSNTFKPIGLEIDDNDYNGRITRRIFARDNTTMEQYDGPLANQPPGQQQQPAHQPQPPRQAPQPQGHQQQPPAQRQAPQPQQQREAPQNRPQPQPQGRPAPPAGGKPYVHGQTVGMAINNAVKIWCEIHGTGQDADDVAQLMSRATDPAFSEFIYTLASDLVRVSQRIESGTLRKSPSERAAKTATTTSHHTPAPQQRAAPPPQRQPEEQQRDDWQNPPGRHHDDDSGDANLQDDEIPF